MHVVSYTSRRKDSVYLVLSFCHSTTQMPSQQRKWEISRSRILVFRCVFPCMCVFRDYITRIVYQYPNCTNQTYSHLVHQQSIRRKSPDINLLTQAFPPPLPPKSRHNE